MEKYSGRSSFDFSSGSLDNIVIVKIEITEMTGKKSRF